MGVSRNSKPTQNQTADKIITSRDELKITYVIFIYYLYLPPLGGVISGID